MNNHPDLAAFLSAGSVPLGLCGAGWFPLLVSFDLASSGLDNYLIRATPVEDFGSFNQ